MWGSLGGVEIASPRRVGGFAGTTMRLRIRMHWQKTLTVMRYIAGSALHKL